MLGTRGEGPSFPYWCSPLEQKKILTIFYYSDIGCRAFLTEAAHWKTITFDAPIIVFQWLRKLG